MAVDLGKQVGPLPLGAWIAVVGTGLGVALYSRRTAGSDTYTEYEDVGGVPGVGTGEVGGWVPTLPGVSEEDGTVAPDDNVTWSRKAVAYLISQGYDAAIAHQAIMKALAGGEAGSMSVGEWTLWRVALMKFGSPPEPVFVTEPGSTVAPPDPPPAPAPPPEPVTVPAPTPSQDPNLAGIAANYLANFARADYWYGSAADAAAQWLREHGFTVPSESLAAWRLHFLRTHDAMAAAYKKGDSAFRTFLNNHPAYAANWFAHGGTRSTSEFRWRF